MKQLLIIMLALPTFLWSQKNTFALEGSVGLNFSFNKMNLIEGYRGSMNNFAQGGGLWHLKAKFQFSKKCLFEFGAEQAAYKYGYHYASIGGAGGGSSAKVYVWGFPLGIETNWLENDYLSFSSGIGLKYRLNRLGSPLNLNASTSAIDKQLGVLYVQSIQESDWKQNDHLLAFYTYLEFCAKLRSNLFLNFTMGFNLGLNKHEMFMFTAKKSYPSLGFSETDNYQFQSKASYLFFGLALEYKFKSDINKKSFDNENSGLTDVDW